MTTLAAQLKKLSVPDAQSSLSTDLRQTSFLYDDREAAKYDRQHFYNIGVNGLHQLVAKDERFEEFEHSLFSQSSQSVQRLMQTSDVNKQLDETIGKFLLMLSPYMQLREAHKALEWLVNRYNVHLRNVDSLMMCLLPFYDQEPFIMGLRILDMSSNNSRSWKWLEPVKKANTYLPQKTLLSHCRSANGFMGLLCNMLAKHIEASKDSHGKPSAKHLVRVISFFTQTVLGVILEGTLSDQILSVLIPTLSKGFKAKDLRDYMVSSFMIFSQLLSICALNTSLLTSMLNVICKNIVPELLPSSLGVIVLMFQKQEISKIPEKALRCLMRHESLTSILSSLCENVKVEPFLTPFLIALTSSALVKPDTSESDRDSKDDVASSDLPFTLLMNILSSVALEKKSVAAVVRLVIDWLQRNPESDTDMEVDGDAESDNRPFEVFRLLERRYFSVLNNTTSKMLVSDETGEVKSVIEKLQLLSVNKAQHDMKLDPEAFVAVCLNHHQGSVRKNAVQQLLQDVTQTGGKASVQHAIVMRLQDDDPEVVDAVLQDPKGLWDLFEDKQLLYSTVVKKLDVLEKSGGKSSDLTMKLLQTLCCMPETDAIDVTETTVLLISYLVPLSQENMKYMQNLDSGSVAFSKLLQHLSKGWLSQAKTHQKKLKAEDLFTTLVVNLVGHITAYLIKQESIQQEMKSLYDCISKTPRPGCAAMILTLVNASLIAKTNTQELKTSLQRLLVTSLSNFSLSEGLVSLSKDTKYESSFIESVVLSCLTELKTSSHLDISLIGFCLESLNMDAVPGSLRGKKFWQLSSETSTESNWLWTRITMFNFLLELSSQKDCHVSQFAQSIFSQLLKELEDVGTLTKLLCGLWISQVDEKRLTVAHQARSLQFAEVYLKSLSDDAKKSIVSDAANPTLPCLLVLLSGKSERARHVSFNLMASLMDVVKDETITFNWFAQKLLKYRQEVENDVAFLSQVMQNTLEDSEIEPPAAKKARKASRSSRPPMSSTGLHYLIDILSDLSTPYVVRLGLLHSCSKLDSVESFIPLMKFLGVLLDQPSSSSTPAEKAASRHSTKLLLHHITPNVAFSMTMGSDSLKVLQRALSCTDMVTAGGDNVQMLTARQLSRKVMSALPPDPCQAIFSQILDIASSSINTEMTRCCRKVIKHMKLSSKLIITEMTRVLGKELAATVKETKRQKVSSTTSSDSAQETDALESKSWKRVTTLLELIQNKKTIVDATPLVPVAFQVLGRVLELETQTTGEYIKQLLLGIIYKICCNKYQVDGDDVDMEDEGKVTGEHLRMELVVQCIRHSDNPHTHHQALLLLSEAAKIAPNLLLHNMMSVFIFMGTSILRQDDEYSFHVIERILENVIPAIRMACEEKNKGQKSAGKKSSASAKGKQEDVMTVVLRVFVDAIPHIPSHRKIMLFQKLLTVLGVDDYLWRVVLLFVENVVQRPKALTEDDEQEQSSGPLSSVDLEFLSNLFEAFSTLECFRCVMVATDYLMKLPEETEKEGDVRKDGQRDITKIDDLSKNDTDIFSVEHHSAKQLRHFKYGSVFALAHLMGSQHLVAELSHQDPGTFLSQYQSMMETVLQFISNVTKSHDLHQQDASGRFWKFLLHKCHDLLDNMVNLLPDSMFMTVVCGLMEHTLPMVQKRAMELLNNKLHYYKESGIHSQQKQMLWPIVTKLQVVAKSTLLPKKSKCKEEHVANGQTAIYGLKVLCRILGETDYQPFLEVLDLCVKALSRHEANGTVCASAMLCVAEVINAAKAHSIEHLKELMPLVIAQLQTPTSEHSVLLVAAITSLQKIIEAVPLFLSPYLTDIVVQICTVNSEVEADAQKPIVVQKIKQICTTVATVTSTRTFLPLMEKSFKALEDKLSDCAECLLSMLKDHIENMNRENLAVFLQDLIKFFFVCFSTRAEKPDMTLSEVAVVEGFVINAFVSLVFKLSESQFKPMLMQLYSWATDDEASNDRVLTFYRVCSSLADNLKNLFTLFAGHILKHSADVLDANNKSKSKVKYFGKGKLARKKSCLLLENVLDCLQKTFHHDTEGFMNKERFDSVMQPIVDQLENMLGKPETVSERVEKFLVPCITSLAHSSKDDHMWKLINYQVLLKTRNEQEKVRLWALSAVDALHKKLGEDYTHLVAETIPFIAELMEDESDEVEKYTHKVVAAMEVSVGENLQEYF